MSETETPVEAMRAFREVLVEARRSVVKNALSIHRANGDGGENWGPALRKVQEEIDAVDRAIADEQLLDPNERQRLRMTEGRR